MSTARKAARGAVWNVGTGVAVRVLGLVGTVVLTRFIAPAQYGEVSAAVVVVGTVTALTGLGFPRYLIARSATSQECFQAFAVQSSVTGGVLVMVVLFGGAIGAWMGVPGLAPFLPGLALAAFMRVAVTTPQSLLARSLRFGRLATANAAGEILFVVTAVALGPSSGAMGIVAGNLARAMATSALILRHSDKREWLVGSTVRIRDVLQMLRFSLPLSASSWLGFLATRWDNVLVAKYFGAVVLGHYSLAINLAQAPVRDLGAQLNDVLFPALASLPEASRASAVVRTTSVMALVLFPIVFGTCVTTPLAVSVVLDHQWAAIGWMASILAFAVLGSAVEWPILAHLTIVGRSWVVFSLGTFRVAATLGCLVLFGWQSPAWACIAVTAAQLASTAATVIALRLELPLDTRALLRATAGPFLSSALMAVVVYSFQMFAAERIPAWLVLTLAIVLGMASYAGAVMLFARSAATGMLGLLHRALSPRSVSGPTATLPGLD